MIWLSTTECTAWSVTSRTCSPDLESRDILDAAEVVFHLAAAVSGECEADFDVGMKANIVAGMAVLDGCRRAGSTPTLVFASSLAVFGGWPDLPLPTVVTDTTLPTPRTSYGVQKFVIEQLVADYTRKGYIAGRSVRLNTVCVRPGRANAAASGFLSAIIREPLAGQRAVCPVPGGNSGRALVTGANARRAVAGRRGVNCGMGRTHRDQSARYAGVS